ncbi:NAD(+) diphosphatase [Demequina globuliformis]|uniref:NAD(+) diphosphatase n=1 Tax=Demequina globuliformis TaxID=676202 RepID=UPI000783324C|nr:NAD(+) diphosphatase [Demequina globuliformis]
MSHASDFSAPGLVDRASHLRDSVHLDRCYAVLVHDGRVAVADSGLALAGPGEQPGGAVEAFLGQARGRNLTVRVPTDPENALPERARWAPLREFLILASALPEGDLEAELALTAVAIVSWHLTHAYCPRCGTETSSAQAGWVRRCPSCERDLYPRTDPAMIVAVTDESDRLLLAHAAHWSERRYSVLAGFVEPGESLEHAVHREVREEVGIEVTDVSYLGSQPWPFPGSLMTGFRARATGQVLRPDGIEITDARWVSRAEFEHLTASGEIVAPPVGSIARSMVQRWLGEVSGPMPAEADDVSDT